MLAMRISLYILFCLMPCWLFAQQGEQQDTSYSQIKILYSETFINEKQDEEDLQFYKGDVKIFHDSTFMFCDSAVTELNILDAVGNIVMLRQDTLKVFGDSLHYDGLKSYAELYGNVALLNGSQSLYSDALYYDIAQEKVSYQDTALMQSERAQLSSLSGYYDLEKDIAHFFGEVVVIDSNLTLRCDTMIYDANISRANFYGPSYITQGENKIYCESGYYETETGNAYFEKNTKFYGDSLNSQSNFIEYDRERSVMILTGDAVVEKEGTLAKAERIEYFDQDSTIVLEGNAYYMDKDSEVYGEYIHFDNAKKTIDIIGDGVLYKDEIVLRGDTIFYDVNTEKGSSVGQVVFEDTLNARLLYSDFLEQENDDNYVAYSRTSRPYIEERSASDTLFLAGDTLRTIEKFDGSDSLHLMRAYHDVRMYSHGMQGVADSLEYNTKDSLISFYGSPVLWADTTQFVADTIIVKNDEEGIQEVFLRSNAMIGNKLGIKFYDQIKGKQIHAKLDSNNIKWMEVKGNAEVIYMLRDEQGAFIGANKTICSYIEFFFEGGELKDIKFHSNPTSHMVPVNQASNTDLYLSDFVWYEDKRPWSLDDILKNQWEEKLEDKEEIDIFEEDVLEIFDQIKNAPK